MTNTGIEAKIGPEGRVVIPSDIRRSLGVGPGDSVLFIADGQGGFTVTTADALVQTMWANNRGGDRFDAGAEVRDFRNEDALKEVDAQERMDTYLNQPVSDERQETERLLSELGFPG